ncbi:hypothetical protein CPC08DRAFT_720771 [Agrocybe pediades]|nr:hypothetical protein CPC08DRAFT_720771 [Agrocybe pediades]
MSSKDGPNNEQSNGSGAGAPTSTTPAHSAVNGAAIQSQISPQIDVTRPNSLPHHQLSSPFTGHYGHYTPHGYPTSGPQHHAFSQGYTSAHIRSLSSGSYPNMHHSSPPPHTSSPLIPTVTTLPPDPPASRVPTPVGPEDPSFDLRFDSENEDPPERILPTAKAAPTSKQPNVAAKSKSKSKDVAAGQKNAKKAKAAEVKARGGRSEGSRNFSEKEMRKIVDLVTEIKPIGGNMWEELEKQYNAWGKKLKKPVATRDWRSLRNKFDQIVKTAKTKPTGDAERKQIFFDALDADALLFQLSGTVALDDNADDVVSLSDSSGDANSVSSQSVKETVATVKSYKVTNPLTSKPQCVDNTTAQVNSTMASMGDFFSSDRVQERDDSQLRELRVRYEQLQESLQQETRRANKLELRNENLKDQLEYHRPPSSRRRHREYTPSPSPPRRRRQEDKDAFAPVASGSGTRDMSSADASESGAPGEPQGDDDMYA